MGNPSSGRAPGYSSEPTVLKLGLKKAIFVIKYETDPLIASEPLYNLTPNDPVCLLSVGDKVEAYFKTLDKVKSLIVTSIDTRYDIPSGGLHATYTTIEDETANLIPPKIPANNGWVNDVDYYDLDFGDDYNPDMTSDRP